MKKLMSIALAGLLALAALAPAATARETGGIPGFLVGCCFGIRSAAAYNEGKNLHWREWALLIPFANIVVEIMNGVDGMNGSTSADLAEQYGSQYY